MKKFNDRSQEILPFCNSVYQGERFNEFPHGLGIAFWNSGNIYFGDWKNGCPDGEGIFMFYSGTLIKAGFVKGKIDGFAELFYLKEFLHEKALFKNGIYFRKEKNYISEKLLGVFKEGKPEGLGIMLKKDCIEVGYFHNGLLNGPGKIYYNEGKICESYFLNGKMHELCLIYTFEKKLWKICYYKDNQEQKELQKGSSTFPPTFLRIFSKANINSLDERIVSNNCEYILMSPFCEQMDKVQRDYIQMNVGKLKEEGIKSDLNLFCKNFKVNEVSISSLKKFNERSKTCYNKFSSCKYTNLSSRESDLLRKTQQVFSTSNPLISSQKQNFILKKEVSSLHKTLHEFYINGLSLNSNSNSTRKTQSKIQIKKDFIRNKVKTTHQSILSYSSNDGKRINSTKKKETFKSCHNFSPFKFKSPSSQKTKKNSENVITPIKLLSKNTKSVLLQKPNTKNLIFNFRTHSAFEIQKKNNCFSSISKKKNNKTSQTNETLENESFKKILLKNEDLLLNEIESVNNIVENILKNTEGKFRPRQEF